MEKLGTKWQKLIIWLTGYLNLIAFILGGGYIYLKTKDEKVKASARLALFVTAVFTALNAFYTLLYNILYLFGAGYETTNLMSDISRVITILEIIVFALLLILDLFGKLDNVGIFAKSEKDGSLDTKDEPKEYADNISD